jgi:hypothetical protein
MAACDLRMLQLVDGIERLLQREWLNDVAPLLRVVPRTPDVEPLTVDMADDVEARQAALVRAAQLLSVHGGVIEDKQADVLYLVDSLVDASL